MDKEEIIRRLKKISEHAVHVTGEPPFIMSLDDGIALDEAILLLKEQEAVEPKTGHWFKIHGGTAAQCTICKCWGQINMKFCPWCGAKMET